MKQNTQWDYFFFKGGHQDIKKKLKFKKKKRKKEKVKIVFTQKQRCMKYIF